MIHVRIDDEATNDRRRFACGIGPALPPGDVWFHWSEDRKAAFHGDEVCPGCYPEGKPRIGTPIIEVSGRPGEKGYAEFCRIARSWGHD